MKYKTLGVLTAALFLIGTGQAVFTIWTPAAEARNMDQLDLRHKQQEMDHYLEELRSNRVPGQRGQAAKLLGIIGDPKALPQLEKTLISDTNTDVRRAAANAIARINQKSSIPRLLEAISINRGRTDVQLAIIQALGDMGDNSRDIVPVMVKFLRSPSPFVREATVEALWKITAHVTVDQLKDPQAYAQMDAQRKKVAHLLNQLLKTEDELVVKLTLTSEIADFRDPETIPILKKIVDKANEHVDVRSLARDALDKLEEMGVE